MSILHEKHQKVVSGLTPQPLTGGSRPPFEGKVRQQSEHPAQDNSLMAVTPKGEPKTQSAIDWLSITIKPGWEGAIYPDALVDRWIESTPARGYNVGREFADGRYESIHTNRPEMGIHIVFSGRCINQIATQSDLSGFDILRWYHDRNAKITRLDVAVDAYNRNLDVIEVYEKSMKGEAETRVKSFRLMTANDGGATFYAGSPQSEAMLRVYDKGVESGAGGDWKRAELQLRDSKAVSVATMLVEAKPMQVGRIIQSVIRGHFDMPEFETWKTVMQYSDPVPVARSNDKQTDTIKWLLETCAPALARVANLHGDEKIIQKFLDAVAAHREPSVSALSSP